MSGAIRRILVPVDFSAHSDRAVRYAATLAGQVGASVALLHVVEDLLATTAYSEVLIADVADVMQATINRSYRQLQLLKEGMFPHGADVETTAVVGRPAHAIVERAASGGFDLVVMGTHGRTGLSHMVMGSVAERVVRTSPCAVLTVRAEALAEGPAAPKAA